ncbi:RDD family protein [Curtobacterium sp. PhB136]|uniref:RDD family protein n=1 Tax=Curtobacterium sp. PhB136 TaxID=2485181 RepID=UPI001050C953|nr:RDD family protein [Curtobacterium sp. PhB136]
MRLGGSRLLAWLVDWACVLGWVALTAAVGVPLYLAHVIRPTNVVVLNVVGALVIVMPVVLALAWCESRREAATVGKRVMKLVVRANARSPRLTVAIARNTLKIGVPWLIGHAAVFTIVRASGDDGVPVGVWALTVCAYVLPLAWIFSLFVGRGRTPYDWACGTEVTRRSAG